MNLNFVILYMDDMDKAKTFYMDALGLSAVEGHSSPDFVTLRSDEGAMIGLQSKSAAQFAPKDETQPGSVELSFAVEDVDDTWRRWKDNGVDIVSDPVDLPFGRYFMAKDPEGHYLSVYRYAQ